MINSNLLTQFFLSTQELSPSQKSKHLKNHPTNNGTKMCKKMEAVHKETEVDTMEDSATYSSNTTSMRTSTCLAAKLKKLMLMDMTNNLPMEVTMEIDTEDQKKQAGTTAPFTGMTTASLNDKTNKTQETKKIWNDETPPRQIKSA